MMRGKLAAQCIHVHKGKREINVNNSTKKVDHKTY